MNYLWFGKAVHNFNIQVAEMGNNGPQLQANLDNGFISRFVKLHGTISKALISSDLGCLCICRCTLDVYAPDGPPCQHPGRKELS